MRKWRPTYKCTYLIPEVHGSFESLKIIFNRILPLRFSVNQEDIVIMMGDYIDKGEDSASVIELLIEQQKLHQDKFICLKGNHEHMMIKAFESNENYRDWLSHGGIATVQSYLTKAGLQSNPASLPFSRLRDIVPPSHIEFLNSLLTHLEFEDYVVFHGGINLNDPASTGELTYMFDTGASRAFKQLLKEGKSPLATSDKVYIGAHNYKDKLPFISSKYFMLGGSAPRNLILFELNSMTCAMIKGNKSRIYKHQFKYFE
jgi:predicted MPP superfamily phosphohydrolase